MRVALTFDIDPIGYNRKVPDYSDCCYDYDKQLSNLLSFCEDLGITGTSFFRSDWDLDHRNGRLDYLFNRFDFISWQRGWHPHLGNNPVEELYNIHSRCHFVRDCQITRLGNHYMTNEIMFILDQLGYDADSSALARRRRDLMYDWYITGSSPYKPFINDFRCPGEPHLDIIEIPITTINGKTVNPFLNSEKWQRIIHLASFQTSVVMLFHPDQLVLSGEGEYENGIEVFMKNIKWMTNEYDVNFVKATDL